VVSSVLQPGKGAADVRKLLKMGLGKRGTIPVLTHARKERTRSTGEKRRKLYSKLQ